MKLKAGQVVAGRYQIDCILGSGGMSVVYRALDTKLDRYVTLKVLREELAEDADFVRRFPIEAMAAAALNHPNIVSIFDYGQDDAIYYIVLEYIDGANLKDIINHYAPFDNDATLGMAIQIADGLTAAHRAGIVHRDIKPQNILVASNSSAKVADFGIARVAKSGTITTSESMGSAHYFSPEQARGGYVDHKTDIYSLGIVMYEMATGQLPFNGDNVVTVALQQINDPLPDMTQINPKISESVARIVLKATEKSPSRRYRDIEEMAEDLKYALSDASGSFVQASDDTAPTQTISQEDREAIIQMQTLPEELYDYDDYDYESNYDNQDEPAQLTPEDKKAHRTAIVAGVALGLIFTLLIVLGSCAVYGRLRTVRITPPDVTGMTYSEAVAAARDARLTITRLEPIFHNEVEEGRIVSQNPSHFHNNMSPGGAIQVTISLGPSPYNMPDILGMDIEYARELLAEFPVELLEIEYEDESAPGTVIRQDPEAGEAIGEGGTIFIYVSLGVEEAIPAQVAVPNLIGRTQAEALDLLREASLIAGIVLQEESTTFASGLIFRQSPMPGEVVDRETLVGFTISIGGSIPTPAPPTPTPEDDPDVNNYPEDPDDPDYDPDQSGENQYLDNQDDPGQPGQDSQPQVTSRILVIQLWEVPEGTEYVHLRVMRHQEGHAPTVATNVPLYVSQFPMEMLVEGSGIVTYRIYAVEDDQPRFIAAYEINFDE